MDHNEKNLKLLEKLLNGATTQSENAFLSSLPESEFDELFCLYSDLHWEEASEHMDPAELERMKKDMLNRISARHTVLSKAKSKPFRTFLQVAACAVVALVFSWAGFTLAERVQEEEYFEVVADNGQRSSLTLPDGSSIVLNSGSSIRYSTGFNRKDRDVILDGEAYFDVAVNEEIPFVVNAQEMEITVLGTKFNVKAYDDESSVIATLIQGKIKAAVDDMTETITPNNRIVYDRALNSLSVNSVDDASISSEWKDGKLVFSGETLEEIASILVRQYDVGVIFKDENCKGVRYNGLVRDNSLDNVLKLITASSTVKCSFEGNNIVFSSK